MGKKNKNKIYNVKSTNNDSDEMVRLFKIVGFVVVVLLLFYLVFAIFSGEISFSSKEEKSEVEIQNTEILAGSTFNREGDEYYVLFYDFDGDNAIKCSSIRSLYVQKYPTNKMYIVDLGSAFNKNYVIDDVKSVSAKDASNLKVVDATLVRVTNGVGTVIAAGIDALANYQTTLLG